MCTLNENDFVHVKARIKCNSFFGKQEVIPCAVTKMIMSNDDGATYYKVDLKDGCADIDWVWKGLQRPNLNMQMNDRFKFFFYTQLIKSESGKGDFSVFSGGGHCSVQEFLQAAVDVNANKHQIGASANQTQKKSLPVFTAAHNCTDLTTYITLEPKKEFAKAATKALQSFQELQKNNKIVKSVLWQSDNMAKIQEKECECISTLINQKCNLDHTTGDLMFAKPLSPMHIQNVFQLYSDIGKGIHASSHIRYPKTAILVAVGMEAVVRDFDPVDFQYMKEEQFAYTANSVLTWFTKDGGMAPYRFDEALVTGAVAQGEGSQNIKFEDSAFGKVVKALTAKGVCHIAESECVDRAFSEPNVNGVTLAGNDCEDLTASALATHKGIIQIGPVAYKYLQEAGISMPQYSVPTQNVTEEDMADLKNALQSPLLQKLSVKQKEALLLFSVRYTDLNSKGVITVDTKLGTALGASADQQTRALGGHSYAAMIYKPSDGGVAQCLVIEGTTPVQNLELKKDDFTLPLSVTVETDEVPVLSSKGFQLVGTDMSSSGVVMEKLVCADEFLQAIGANPFMQTEGSSFRRCIPFASVPQISSRPEHSENVIKQKEQNSFYQKVFVSGENLIFEKPCESNASNSKLNYGVNFLEFANESERVILNKPSGVGMDATEFAALKEYKNGLLREAYPPSFVDKEFTDNMERVMEKITITASPQGEAINDYLQNTWTTYVSESFFDPNERQKAREKAAIATQMFNTRMKANGNPHQMVCAIGMCSVFRILKFDRKAFKNNIDSKHIARHM